MSNLNELIERRGQLPRILIVDDQPAIIYSLQTIFDSHYEIFFATSGRDALKMCKEALPDLVILDIKMPDLNGLDVCRSIKEDNNASTIPVIFLTSSREEVDEIAGFEVGAADFIYKPINPVIFKARLLNHLALKFQTDILRDLAETDGLTGIANRRRFEEQFHKEWRHFMRTSEPLSLLMIDVDYFKRYNDTYGHLAGDDCLKRIAATLSSAIKRPHDFIARYGGEEFVVILPRTGGAEAGLVAEKMLEAVRNLKIEHRRSDVSRNATISIGVAEAAIFDTADSKRLKSAADFALYRAKNLGRNQARICDITEYSRAFE
ncbi:hypothetical protein WM40_11740 [Robbsia andropogonis]|uniref:diguanylate cyclase n=1 Tax=Robbsia andropogonis TaxID=28092 RepID=A0A0F5K1I0_9BURK|nr:diguanylate cyclase [Robbsia andropogonis]KKB63407.1 hypothetical protein WM40_11740 [Robbsia andropogonis]MCP1120359.1 diguanylate cyclase [Robbsia andropogonis]MCP1130287.1 diguanylate cyclase [Robbsia andropogonis]